MFITFIYRIGNRTNQKYFGKYFCDYISDDHEGLDREIKYVLEKGLNRYREIKEYPSLQFSDIKVGILSFSDGYRIPVDSTEKEIELFDFYAICENYHTEYYINGELIK